MAKGQMRGNKEARKPKQEKSQKVTPAASLPTKSGEPLLGSGKKK